MQYSDVFEAAPAAVGLSRRRVGDLLREADLGHLVDRAEVATTELVTNAISYGGAATLRVEVEVTDRSVVVSVHDASSAPPMRRDVGCDSVGGRGVAMVDAVSDSWGFEPTPDGKRVWCGWDTANAQEARAVLPGPLADAWPG